MSSVVIIGSVISSEFEEAGLELLDQYVMKWLSYVKFTDPMTLVDEFSLKFTLPF